jgi:hypothetical protein
MKIQQETQQHLRLCAEDADDLCIISAHLQDAVLPVGAMRFDPDNRIFELITDRFCWEHEPEQHGRKKMYKRTKSGVRFKNVRHVKHRKLQRNNPDVILELLRVHANNDNEIVLHFAGGTAVCLEVENIDCYLCDSDTPRWTSTRPEHTFA